MKKWIFKLSFVTLASSLCLLVGILAILNHYSNINNLKFRQEIIPSISLIDGHTYELNDTLKFDMIGCKDNFQIVITSNVDTTIYEFDNFSSKLSDQPFNDIQFFPHYKVVLKTIGINLISVKINNKITYNTFVYVNNVNEKNEIVYVLSDYNWNAYNTFGGISNYRNYTIPIWCQKAFAKLFHKPIVNKDEIKYDLRRPNPKNHNEINSVLSGQNLNEVFIHMAGPEFLIIEKLIKEYGNIKVIDCKEYESVCDEQLASVVIFGGHAEYWSIQMINKFVATQSLCKYLFLSGNNCYRLVDVEGYKMRVISQQIPEHIVAPLLGTYYDAIDYQTQSPIRLVDKPDWLKLDINTTFNSNIMGYETDKISKYSPSNLMIVAQGTITKGDVVYIDRGKGSILNFSSVNSWKIINDSIGFHIVKSYISSSLSQ